MRVEVAPAALIGHDKDVGLRFARAFVGRRKDFITVCAVMRQDDLGFAPAARALPIQINRERLLFGPRNIRERYFREARVGPWARARSERPLCSAPRLSATA